MWHISCLVLCVVAAALAPLFRPCSCPGSLDSIREWGLQGPGADLPIPLVGVYVPVGLNPVFLFDLSYAHSWNLKKRSFVLDFGGPGIITFPHNYEADFTGEFRTTSPVPSLTGRAISRAFRLLRFAVKFEFNEDFSSANIHPTLLTEYNVFIAWLANAFVIREELVSMSSGVWKRQNFAPPSNSTPTDAHYFLHPVLTKDSTSGKVRLHPKGLAMAGRKLKMAGAGGAGFMQCADRGSRGAGRQAAPEALGASS